MSWIPYSDIDFDDKSIKAYHVDTRDFHCSVNDHEPDDIVLKQVNKNPLKYYHTGEEVKLLIDRYFKESGGKSEWRMFTLSNEGKLYTDGWQMKYIRIFRYPKGLLVCSSNNQGCYPLSKQILSYKVNQKNLHSI